MDEIRKNMKFNLTFCVWKAAGVTPQFRICITMNNFTMATLSLLQTELATLTHNKLDVCFSKKMEFIIVKKDCNL